MKADYTHITLILDRSGSMASIQSDVVGGVNAFLETQRAVPGECTFTLVQFDSQNPYEVLHDFKPLRDVRPLKKDDFLPRGGTPLYDALGRGIVGLGERLAKLPEHERPSKVVFVTMTDGMENSSREYAKPRIVEMTTRQRETYSWQFVYLGADQDGMEVGSAMGHASAHSASFSKGNFSKAISLSSRKLASFRGSSKVSDLDYSPDDRNELLKPDSASSPESESPKR